MLFNTNFSPLAGAYCCGFFLHQSSIPMLKNNKEQKNNVRDVTVGYMLVLFSYMLSGVFGYIGFIGFKFASIQQTHLMQSGNIISEVTSF